MRADKTLSRFSKKQLYHTLPFIVHLTNILTILIKMVDFKYQAWATNFTSQTSRIFFPNCDTVCVYVCV